MKTPDGRELRPDMRVVAAVVTKTLDGFQMFYVYDLPRETNGQTITLAAESADDFKFSSDDKFSAEYGEDDIDFVDDALLNTAPHNVIEQQLLRGDVVGLALMSGAILWSAMGAFG